jgi:hypothetical protein
MRRRHHLSAYGISIALLVAGAASPVLGWDSESPGGGIKGNGRSARVANFSISVRQDRLERGRFDYRSVDGRYTVRCDGFDSYSPRLYIQAGPPAATVKSSDCWLRGPHERTKVTVEAEFVDNSSFSRGKKDEANLTFTRPDNSAVTDRGPILSGDITVR